MFQEATGRENRKPETEILFDVSELMPFRLCKILKLETFCFTPRCSRELHASDSLSLPKSARLMLQSFL